MLWLVATATSCTVSGAAAGLEFFEKEIRPLLAAECYECHSTAGGKNKGGLLLDSRDGWMRGGDSGPALVPGNPAESLLIKAVRHHDSRLEMPPKKKLGAREIEALEKWVRMGAPDPRTEVAPPVSSSRPMTIEEGRSFWAYCPPVKHPAPSVRETAWPRTDLDRFILARLEERNLRPVPDADRATLIRRATFALTGLPPSPEAIDAFTADTRPDWWERLVDMLLASPGFGERWGRHWLDVARFGESVTLRGFIFPEAWRYRDYVIDSFNRDLAFDQFVREQVAGDLLGGDTLADHQRRMAATTFLTLGNTNFEEQDKKQLDMDVVDEQLDVIGKAFLGQTIGCARCHDHKFDPIPTRDYYALAGILRGVRTLEHANVSKWIERPLPLEPDLEERLRRHEAEVSRLEQEIKNTKETIARLKGRAGAETNAHSVAADSLPGVVVDDSRARTVGAWKRSQHVAGYVGDGYLHDDNEGKGNKTVTFLPELPAAGRYEVRLSYTHGANRSARVPATVFSADGEFTVEVNQQHPPKIDGRFVSLGEFRFELNGQGFVIVSNEGTEGHVIADAVQFLPLDGTAASLARSGTRDATVEGDALADTEINSQTSNLGRLEQQLKQLKSAGPRRPMVMAVREEKAGDIPVHIRGSVHNLGETVPRGFLTVTLPGPAPLLPEGESGRRELAAWLASRDNPLTARVMVNRAIHWLFGAGLVPTTDNFGTTGDAPSHPELLDHLAVAFMEHGWSVKWLVRELALSRTFMLATVDDPEAQAVDPENRLLWRMHRKRLEAEALRDAVLVTSGQLPPGMGGPTFPPTLNADYNFRHESPRRSVYLPVFRNALPEWFDAFDFADPSMVTGRRDGSTVATQALFLLNHPVVRKHARDSASRLLSAGPDEPRAKLQLAYRTTLGRHATPAEEQIGLDHLRNAMDGRESELDAWAEIFHALFASVEFRYLN